MIQPATTQNMAVITAVYTPPIKISKNILFSLDVLTLIIENYKIHTSNCALFNLVTYEQSHREYIFS